MFRFTIRELVLLTIIVAMGAGWWLDRSPMTQQNSEMRVELKLLRFEVLRARELHYAPPTNQALFGSPGG